MSLGEPADLDQSTANLDSTGAVGRPDGGHMTGVITKMMKPAASANLAAKRMEQPPTTCRRGWRLER